MALSNIQYDEIMRGYQERQLHNRHLTEKRRKDLFLRLPQLQEIEDRISSISMECARKRLDGDLHALAQLKRSLADLRLKRQEIIKANGYDEHDLDPIYTCPDCKDTGYIDGQKCHCFRQEIINVVYSQSNIRNILDKENFSTFSYEYYSDEITHPTTGRTSLDAIHDAVNKCRHFIDDFDNKPKNLLFYGNTGIGKTFLSNCIAKELLEKGNSVIYFTAFQLFDILSKGIFERDADAITAHQNIFDCDLLIIDDLGTELSNSFTTSQLFLCVNERILRGKSTIISSNLNPRDLLDTYSERTFSRISSNYTIINLFGDDIRLKKRQKH